MSDIDIQEIEKRANAASSGPWEMLMSNGEVKGFYAGDEWALVAVQNTRLGEIAHLSISQENANFIQHARQDILALLAENKKLRDRDRYSASLHER